jgi:hypothetical protein
MFLKSLWRFFVLAVPPPPPPSESGKTVTTSAAADPVDFDAMAAKQNRCAETQRLLCGSSIQLAFCQAGT